MGTVANSEDPDEMPHNVAFYPGLLCCNDKNNLHEQKFIEILKFQPVTP